MSGLISGEDGTIGDGSIEKVDSSADINSPIVLRIHAIEYFLGYFTGGGSPAARGLFSNVAAVDDNIKFGMSFLAAAPEGGFLETSPGVIDFNRFQRKDIGTAATGILLKDPYILKDMHVRYPDGILVHPASLYKWSYVQNALAGAYSIAFKIYYTTETIDTATLDSFWKQIFVTQAG